MRTILNNTNDDIFVTLYNTEKKEPVGIFRSFAMAARYVFTEKSTWNQSRMYNSFMQKTKLHSNTIFDFPIAVRLSNELQRNILGNKDYHIFDSYPIPYKRKLPGMTSSRIKFNK